MGAVQFCGRLISWTGSCCRGTCSLGGECVQGHVLAMYWLLHGCGMVGALYCESSGLAIDEMMMPCAGGALGEAVQAYFIRSRDTCPRAIREQPVVSAYGSLLCAALLDVQVERLFYTLHPQV